MKDNELKKDALQMLVDLLDYHTRMFPNVLVDISEADANNRLGTKANHPSWLAGSLVEGRFEMAKILGIEKHQAAHELFKDFKGIQDEVTYPVLNSYLADWDVISPLLKTAVENASAELWNSPETFGMGGNFTMFEAFAFCIDRESYVLGQLGLWRRLLGYPAMKYPE